ncbi:MAG: DUF2200 domain-containing protein [Corynebacterium sp.]|uniref:DUF2200 domain-containing protein n=1 Tax=Corynebacterium sp. TaxID=1720 RepID=UPI0026DF26DF|nr:DUF2200 domain-containing protein [Corynebacterium sp.]MDO5670890.1 DUF2200 domain-containing protein [Corynebacterium sp.]
MSRVFDYPWADIYRLYVAKVERKGRSVEELAEVLGWLTGYSASELQEFDGDLRAFFAEAPAMTPDADRITGVVCGVRVEEVEDPLMQQIRWADKLVDELAKGKAVDKIKRA